MRLKSYNAPTMAEAMRMVREELGEDAIIVSTQRSSDGQGVRITAALEDPGDDEDINRALSGKDTTPFGERVREALEYHGTPARLVEKMVQAAMAVEVGSPTMQARGRGTRAASRSTSLNAPKQPTSSS